MNNPFTQPETISAILPVYTIDGDSTTILRSDGSSTEVAILLRSAVHRLARSLVVDLSALKQNCGQATSRTILQPLPLSLRLVLFPVKVRTPRVKGDNTIGYINLADVATVTANPDRPQQAIIALTGGQQIPIIWTKTTVQKQMQLARLAAAASPRSRLATRLQEDPVVYGTKLATIIKNNSDPQTEVYVVVVRASR